MPTGRVTQLRNFQGSESDAGSSDNVGLDRGNVHATSFAQ